MYSKSRLVLTMEKRIIKIKLFGESFKVYRLNNNQFTKNRSVFQSIAKQLNESLESALQNIIFFDLLNKQYNLNHKSIYEFVDQSYGGLNNNKKAKIEIRKGRKHISNLSLSELFYPKTLFPLFNTTAKKRVIELKNNDIYLLEKEVGLVSEYEINTEVFDIYKLKFSLGNINFLNQNYQLLLQLTYDGEILENCSSDTLLTYQHCLSSIN